MKESTSVLRARIHRIDEKLCFGLGLDLLRGGLREILFSIGEVGRGLDGLLWRAGPRGSRLVLLMEKHYFGV